MDTLTIERPVEQTTELKNTEQALRAFIASPQPYWPLPGTLVTGARLTWPEWVALLAERLARARDS